MPAEPGAVAPCRLSRRGLLLGGLGGLLAACASQPDRTPAPSSAAGSPSSTSPASTSPSSTSPSAPPSPTGTPAPDASETAAPVPAPVDVPAYAVLPGEVEPECKEAAVTAVAAALTWRDGAFGPAAAASRVGALGSPAEAVSTLLPLLRTAAWSSVEVVYPQYGGLVADLSSASVMVNAQQVLPSESDVVRRPVTFDVRLVQARAGWRATEVLLTTPPAPARQVSDAARALLANERVVLPAAARGDVLAGIVDDVVLELLASLSLLWRLHVQVFSTGHPFTVFGTDRQSNHTRGRAVDVWAVDDVPVIDHERSSWREVMLATADIGGTEIGGPVDVDGVRGQRPFFSDHVHQDHVHLGFEPVPPL